MQWHSTAFFTHHTSYAKLSLLTLLAVSKSITCHSVPVSVHKHAFKYVCQHVTYFFLIFLCLHMNKLQQTVMLNKRIQNSQTPAQQIAII